MDKNILVHQDARDKIIAGANKVADIVKTTMGAKGKLVVIQDPSTFYPILTKDGISVADYVQLEDGFEDLGARMIKQATQRTLDEVQDATTTATVLAQALINNGLSSSPREIAENYKQDLETTINALNKLSKKASKKQLKQIANIACNSDKVIADLVSTAFKHSDSIKIESHILDDDSLELYDGLHVDTGITSHYFATDKKKMEAHLKDALVLIYAEPIQHMEEIHAVIDYATTAKRPLLIIAPEIEPSVLHRLIMFNTQGLGQVVYLRAPENGKRSIDLVSDIAYVTKATVQTIYKAIEIEGLGFAKEVIIRPLSTSIVTGTPTAERIKEITPLLKEEDGYFAKRRIQNLASSLAIIKVGGLTDIEQRERKDRYDDAVGAVRSAIKGGVVPGAGNALAFIAQNYKLSLAFRESLFAPMETILNNAEIEPTPQCLEWNTGFNVISGAVTNLSEEGIIDSTNSIIKALESATSVAINILNTNAVIKC